MRLDCTPNVPHSSDRRKPVTTSAQFIRRRLLSQRLARTPDSSPASVVAWFGAVQAQDYLGGLWAIGQRCPGATQNDVELAITERSIVRTWPMRGTLHFVAADDARWMLELMASRVIQQHAGRLHREFELDSPALSRCRKVLVKALTDRPVLMRQELYDELEGAGIPATGQRGGHILGRLAMEGLLCFGPRRGKQQTMVLLDEWLPEGRGLLREEALGELALRYFASHGPATVQDLSWWSGLTLGDCRSAIAMVSRQLIRESMAGAEYFWTEQENFSTTRLAGTAHLLPPFDEYLVGYRDRTAVLDPRHAGKLQALLSPVIEVDGRIVGTWKRRVTRERILVGARSFRGEDLPRNLGRALKEYGQFLGVPATLY
jgi:hypothetical protein